MKKVHPTYPPSHRHIYKEKEMPTQNWKSDRKGIKIVWKPELFFLSSLRSPLLLLPLQSETAFLSYYPAHLIPSKDLVFNMTSGIKPFFCFSLECYMQLLGAAEDILITAVSYSLWNEKLFCLFICFFETIHSFRSFRENKKDLADHVQQQKYYGIIISEV